MPLTSAQKILVYSSGSIAQNTPPIVGGSAQAYLVPALNAGGQIDVTMLPTGVGPDVDMIQASEAIAAGALVNVWNNAGSLAVRNADQTNPSKQADGFVLSAIASGATGTVYLNPAIITGLTGLTQGSIYYLGTVGALTLTAPSAAGSICQQVGKALSATQFQFNPQLTIAL